MWYVLPDSNKQYPLTIERVRKIKQLNGQGVIPEGLEPVEVNAGKTKEEEPAYADLVGQISLKSLDKSARKKKHTPNREAPRQNHNPNKPGPVKKLPPPKGRQQP